MNRPYIIFRVDDMSGNYIQLSQTCSTKREIETFLRDLYKVDAPMAFTRTKGNYRITYLGKEFTAVKS